MLLRAKSLHISFPTIAYEENLVENGSIIYIMLKVATYQEYLY